MNLAALSIYTDPHEFNDSEEVMEHFEDVDQAVSDYKWSLAKMWMYGENRDLTSQEYLAVAGLI